MRTAANGQNVFGSAAKPKVHATAPGKKDNYKGSSTVSTKTTTSKSKGSKNKNKNKGKNKGKNKKNTNKKQKYIQRLFDR